MLDIALTPVNLVNGITSDQLPGLITLSAPRKAARGRETDVLVVLASINGAAGITADSLNSWLNKKALTFFSTAGTVTLAMKTLLETMNTDLMERNLRRAKEGKHVSASLLVLVVRGEKMYLASTGGSRAFLSTITETAEISDPETKNKGLGLSQSVVFQLVQKEIHENDVIIISSQPAEIWNSDLFKNCTGLSSDAVARRLFQQAGKSFDAVIIRCVRGKGVVTLTPFFTSAAAMPPADSQTSAAKQTTPDAISSEKSLPEWIVQEIDQTELVKPEISSSVDHAAQDLTAEPISEASEVAEARDAAVNAQKSGPSPLQVKAGKITQKVVMNANQAGSSFNQFLQKILPGLAEEPLKLSRNSLIAISLVVPIAILLLAGLVYMKQGQSKQFDQNLVMAQQYYMQAELQVNDPPLYLASLQQSLFWLDKAESYGKSDLSNSLREKVQGELDILQGVKRLEMVEVIAGGLPAGTVISQIVASATDLYLLDEESGTIKRYYMGSAGYEKDEDFDCGPNPDNPLNQLGKLIDMVPLNVNNQFKATLLGVDAKGNTVFCVPNDAGIAGSLVPPDQGWKQLRSISLDGGYLYALDSGGRAVYRYEGNGVLFENKPVLFFDNQIPDVTKAIDIEVNGDELYILRDNGQMVECTYSHLKDYKLTECLDPAPYGDMRTGQNPEAISFPESDFVQMRMTAAPDSSIYLLDANGKALYHFSLQRNLQKILHPRLMDGYNLDSLSPTAIAVSSSRTAFIAFGSQIYYAQLP